MRGRRYDLEAMLAAVTDRTKPLPSFATRTIRRDDEHLGSSSMRTSNAFRAHVVTVLDQGLPEYVDHPDYADGIEDYEGRSGRSCCARSRRSSPRRTARRIRHRPRRARYCDRQGPARVRHHSPAQVAALASLGAPGAKDELERRRRVNAEGRPAIVEALRVTASSRSNLSCELRLRRGGRRPRPLFEQLLREGVIVRPTSGFGAPGAIRVTVGTPEENAFFRAALGRVTELAVT